MPIFEYKCQECGQEFEELVFDRDECPPCKKCGSAKTSKLMSCCRVKSGGGADVDPGESSTDSAPSVPSGCAGCSGGDCSSCG